MRVQKTQHPVAGCWAVFLIALQHSLPASTANNGVLSKVETDIEDIMPEAGIDEYGCNTTSSISDIYSMPPAKWNPKKFPYFHGGQNCTNETLSAQPHKVPSGQFFSGVLLALFGSTGESLGFTLMKLAHDNAHLKAIASGESAQFYLQNPSWWGGFMVFLLGNIMDFAAFGLAGQAITILVGCWTLVVNLYTAPLILGETRKWVDLVGAVIIMSGIGMAVAANPRKDREWTTTDLVQRYTDAVVIVLMAAVSGIALTCYIITRTYHKKFPMSGARGTEASSTEIVQSNVPLSIRLAHVLLAAMVGTITVCFAKAASEMLIQSVTGEDDPSNWGILIVLIFIVSLPAQLHFVNVSLMVNDALFHIPIFYVFWQVGATITGGVLYQEFVEYQVWQLILYGIGVFFLLLGIKISSARIADLETKMSESPSDLKLPTTVEALAFEEHLPKDLNTPKEPAHLSTNIVSTTKTTTTTDITSCSTDIPPGYIDI